MTVAPVPARAGASLFPIGTSKPAYQFLLLPGTVDISCRFTALRRRGVCCTHGKTKRLDLSVSDWKGEILLCRSGNVATPGQIPNSYERIAPPASELLRQPGVESAPRPVLRGKDADTTAVAEFIDFIEEVDCVEPHSEWLVAGR